MHNSKKIQISSLLPLDSSFRSLIVMMDETKFSNKTKKKRNHSIFEYN